MIRLIWKETGEEFILPTPDNKPCKIDTLPKDEERCDDCGFKLVRDPIGFYVCWNSNCIRNKIV